MYRIRTFALVSLLVATTAFGQQSDNKGAGCESKNWDVAIRACTALIASRGASDSTLVTGYLNRAEAKVETGDLGGIFLLDVDDDVVGRHVAQAGIEDNAVDGREAVDGLKSFSPAVGCDDVELGCLNDEFASGNIG